MIPAFRIPGTRAIRIPADRLDALSERWAREGFARRKHKYPKTRRPARRKAKVATAKPEVTR